MNDEDAEVRVCAALSLAQAGDLAAPVLDLLFDATDWRRDPEAGDRARWGIVVLGKTNPQIVTRLLAALAERRLPLAGVAQCLEQIGQAAPDVKPAIVDGLLAYVRQDQGAGSYALASALAGLVRLGSADDDVIDRMLTLYGRGDTIVRNWWLLGGGDPHLLSHLYTALDDPAEMVRTSAATSLRRLGK